MGESYSSEENGFGINQEILERLFSLIKEKQPEAVVFTGDMTLGLLNNGSEKPSGLTGTSSMNEYALANNRWPREGYYYDSGHFQKQIAKFLEIKQRSLGDKIPLYPVIARHEAFGSDASSIVMKAFPLREPPLREKPLIYTFAVGKALFLVFSIAEYDPIQKKTVDGEFTAEVLRWIDLTLKRERSNYNYIFVVGNQPAFSTQAVLDDPVGLDRNPYSRDRFWDLLMKHKVTAYFCSLEHLYDRTNRFGVWQIISGGGGSPFYKREFDKAFYHYLLLTLPTGTDTFPLLQVFDVQGNVIDEFKLNPAPFPIYQLRIS